jgi:hypothetical protein
MSTAVLAGWPRRRWGFRLLPDVRLVTLLFSLVTRAVLLAILVGVVGFLVLFAYFLGGRSWSMPVILSAGQERVMQAQRDWLERNLRAAELGDRIEVARRQLVETENATEMARISAEAVAISIREDARQNAREIEAIREASATLTSELWNATSLLGRIERGASPETNLAAGLINRARYLSEMRARTDLSISISTLSVTLAGNATRLASLERRAESLQAAQAILDSKPGERLGYEELQRVQAWSKARQDLWAGEEESRRLRRNIEQLDAMRTELIRSLRPLADSPLLAASRAPTVVVFVPYENSRTYRPGNPVYRCRVWLVACEQIGTIGPLIDGEVSLPHPLYGRYIRGGFHSVDLTSGAEAAQDALLFSGKPLFF